MHDETAEMQAVAVAVVSAVHVVGVVAEHIGGNADLEVVELVKLAIFQKKKKIYSSARRISVLFFN